MHVIPVRPSQAVRAAATDWRTPFARFGLYLAGFLAVLNISIIYLALPDIRESLGAGLSDQQWIVSIYPLMEGSFALAAGTIGDQYGRNRILTLSVGLFVLASFACALSQDPTELIVARAAQGIGGAALLSLPFAMLLEMLPDPRRNAPTIALFTTVAALAAGLAPLIGGALVQFIAWPAMFYFSAFLGLTVLAGLRFVNKDTGFIRTECDLWGQLTSIIAIVAISYAMIEGDQAGWASPIILTAFGTAGAGFALFLVAERYATAPMIHLEYFKLRAFNAAMLLVGVVNFGWYGVMLVVSLFMQDVQGLDELATGVYLIPCNAAYFLANLYSNKLRTTIGFRAATALSFAVSIGGMAWLAVVTQAMPPWEVSAALGMAGFGWGLICTPATAVGMAACEPADEGFASGTLAFGRSLFGVFGIAVLGSLLSGGMTRRIGDGMRAVHAPEQSVAQATRAVVHGDLFAVASPLTPLVHQSFVDAMHYTMVVCACLTLLSGIVILLAISGRAPNRRQS